MDKRGIPQLRPESPQRPKLARSRRGFWSDNESESKAWGDLHSGYGILPDEINEQDELALLEHVITSHHEHCTIIRDLRKRCRAIENTLEDTLAVLDGKHGPIETRLDDVRAALRRVLG